MDHESLRYTLSECIDQMDPDSHPADALINIPTSAIAHTRVNIDDSVTLGQEQLGTYKSSLPEGFYNSIKQKAITFSDTKNAVKVGGTVVIDQEAIFARVIGLLVSQWELDLTDVLSCELAAYTLSMFNPDESMRIATNKACLKSSLAVETFVMGTALCYCCGCLSSSVDITLAPTRYCPNINQYVQGFGCKQTQQFGCPSDTGQVFWLL